MPKSFSKFEKWKIQFEDSELKPFLPYTKSFNYQNLETMLDSYTVIFVKPKFGSGGAGVKKLTKLGDSSVEIHMEKQKKIYHSTKEAYDRLKRIQGKTSYMVQQGIPLAKVDDRPFDIRVMVQKNSHGQWEITGKLAKIAGPMHVVSNVHRSRGKIVPLEYAVEKSLTNPHVNYQSIANKLDQICLTAAKTLNKYYRSIHTIGFDMGIESNGRIWIIEDNFRPATFMFNRLKDKSMYRTIIRYKARRKG